MPGAAFRRTLQHHWSMDRIASALGWLRARNVQGWHIHGRPWSPRHVLLDDLTHEALAAQHRPAHADTHGRFPVARRIYADGPCVTPGAAALIAEAREAAARTAGGRTCLPPLTRTALLPRRGRLTPRTPEAAEATRGVAASLPPGAALARPRIDAAMR